MPVLHAAIQPTLPPDFPRDRAFFAFAGIGRPEKFYATCRAAGLRLEGTRDFPDHHLFRDAELGALFAEAEARNLRLITTGKDWVRLPDHLRTQVEVLPVDLVFEDEALVRQLVLTESDTPCSS